MTGRRRIVWALALAAGSCGLAYLASGLWIPAKAALAQVLLRQAWQASRDSGQPVRAWPWADSAPLARLSLAGRDMVVLSGGSGEALAFAPAHVPGSAQPGAAGLSIIAGHRDTHFDVLRHLAPGDAITLEGLDGQQRRYRITTARILPTPNWPATTQGPARLALVTCWPFDAVATGGPERFMLLAEAM